MNLERECSTHPDIINLAAERSVHIHCEKPLAASRDGATQVDEYLSNENLITQMGYAFRYAENFKRAFNIINSGVLGAIERIQIMHIGDYPEAGWFYEPQFSGGGVFIDKLPHLLDILARFCSEDPTVDNVKYQRRKTDDVEDYGEIRLQYGGTTVDIIAGYSDDMSVKKSTIVGSEGYLTVNVKKFSVEAQGESLIYKYGEPPTVYFRGLIESWFGKETTEDIHEKRIHDLLDHVSSKNPTQIPISGYGVSINNTIFDIYEAMGDIR